MSKLAMYRLGLVSVQVVRWEAPQEQRKTLSSAGKEMKNHMLGRGYNWLTGRNISLSDRLVFMIFEALTFCFYHSTCRCVSEDQHVRSIISENAKNFPRSLQNPLIHEPLSSARYIHSAPSNQFYLSYYLRFF